VEWDGEKSTLYVERGGFKMNIINGTKKIKRGTLTAVAEIWCSNNYTIHVFQGGLSPNDILLKYTSPKNSRLRTPKHIHWAVDLLLKKAGNSTTTNAFLASLGTYWNNCGVLPGNTFIDINNVVTSAVSSIVLGTYTVLDQHGEYPTEFLYILMCLLAVQEKTNATYGGTTAHMFNDVLNELAKNNLDIFKIMSTAGFSGR